MYAIIKRSALPAGVDGLKDVSQASAQRLRRDTGERERSAGRRKEGCPVQDAESVGGRSMGLMA